MKKILFPILLLIILALIVINLFVLFKYNKLKNELLVDQEKSSIFYQQLKLINSHLFHEQINNNIKLEKGLILKDSSDKEHTLNEIFRSGHKLVLKNSENGCSLCIENEIDIIKKYISLIGNKNIVVITSNTNTRRLINFKRMNNINFDVFSCDNLGLPFEKKDNLFVFIGDSSLTVKHFFIPEKTLPKLSESYYSSICKKYFHQSAMKFSKY
jgi:hypothetical protein